jgi:RNA polymerase sigma-54 factor
VKKEEPTLKQEESSEKTEVEREGEPIDLDDFADKWDIRHREGQDLSRNSDMLARRDFYENSITKDISLRAHLLGQLRLAVADEASYNIGERIIIGDIDERGYFTGDFEEIAAELGVEVEEVASALAVIQRFEPTGMGARTVEECLLLQIAVEFPEDEELKELVRDHMQSLKRRQIPQIAKAMKVTTARVEELKNTLSALNPWPGHEFSSGAVEFVAPEVVVEKVEGKFVVRLVGDRIPELNINDTFVKKLRDSKMSKEEREYIREKVDSARWLQRNITQRQQTILKVAQAIVGVQEAFFEKGVEHIVPLKLQDIADVVSVHESTVARTTRGKYIQTPQGLFELKYFFSPGLQKDSGESQSSKSIQAMVEKIINEEDKKKPLSDQKISVMLKEQGVNVARRTVAKYREGRGILPTNMRREYS